MLDFLFGGVLGKINMGWLVYKSFTTPAIDFTAAFENSKIMDNVVTVFQNFSYNGVANLQQIAMTICLLLIIIDFATDWTLYDGTARISKYIDSIIRAAFFIFLIYNWPTLVGWTEEFFSQVGLYAGNIKDKKIITCSDILNQGFKICYDLFDGLLKALGVDGLAKAKTASTSSGSVASQAGTAVVETGKRAIQFVMNTFTGGKVYAMQALVYLSAIVLVVFSHFWIAFQLFLCRIEFYIFVALATIFLPFGVCRYTKFLFDRTIQGVVNFSVKLMGIYFLLAIAQNGIKLTTQGVITADKSFAEYMQIGLLYLTIAFLVWIIPEKLGAIMSGSPSLSGREALATGMAAGAVAYGGAKYVASIPGRALDTYSDITTTWDRTKGDYVEVYDSKLGRNVWQYQVDAVEPGVLTRATRYVKFQAQQGLLGSVMAPYVRGAASAQRRNENWVHMKNGDWGAIRYDYK